MYIICKLTDVVDACENWCFTDGHAKDAFSRYYNQLNDLHQVDWSIVGERIWHNTEEDLGRMHRKQAEFLVKEFVPAACIAGLATYTEAAEARVKAMVAEAGLTLKVKTHKPFYY